MNEITIRNQSNRRLMPTEPDTRRRDGTRGPTHDTYTVNALPSGQQVQSERANKGTRQNAEGVGTRSPATYQVIG